MSGIITSVLVAAVAMTMIICISLIPVSALRRLAEKFGWIEQPPPDQAKPRSASLAKAAAAVKMMDFYMHDAESRKITRLIAAHNNLHPLNFEDVMTQMLFVRRDLGRIRRLVSMRDQDAGIATSKIAPTNLGDFGSVVYEDIASPRQTAVEVRHFTQVADVPELHRSGVVRIGARRKVTAFSSRLAQQEVNE